VQVMKLLVIQSPNAYSHFLSLRSTYSPWYRFQTPSFYVIHLLWLAVFRLTDVFLRNTFQIISKAKRLMLDNINDKVLLQFSVA